MVSEAGTQWRSNAYAGRTPALQAMAGAHKRAEGSGGACTPWLVQGPARLFATPGQAHDGGGAASQLGGPAHGTAFWSANFTTSRLVGPTGRPLKALMAARAWALLA